MKFHSLRIKNKWQQRRLISRYICLCPERGWFEILTAVKRWKTMVINGLFSCCVVISSLVDIATEQNVLSAVTVEGHKAQNVMMNILQRNVCSRPVSTVYHISDKLSCCYNLPAPLNISAPAEYTKLLISTTLLQSACTSHNYQVATLCLYQSYLSGSYPLPVPIIPIR